MHRDNTTYSENNVAGAAALKLTSSFVIEFVLTWQFFGASLKKSVNPENRVK